MAISKIKLNNFQAHGSLQLDLDPRITTITGATDSGKSAILRALRWACLNDIRGDAFVKEDADSASVLLLVDGEKVARARKGEANEYRMGEEVYKAFGNEVPRSLQDLLKLSPINFQGQHDAPFWFGLSAGDVSRELNAVVDLGIIDSSLSYLAGLVRRSQDRAELLKERVDLAEAHVARMEAQKSRPADFKALQGHHEKKEASRKRKNTLGLLVKSLFDTDTKAKEQRLEELEGLLSVAEEWYDLFRTAAQLRARLLTANLYEKTSQPPPSFDPVASAWETAMEKAESQDKLGRLIFRVVLAETAAERGKKSLVATEQKFHSETDGTACPLCGQIIAK